MITTVAVVSPTITFFHHNNCLLVVMFTILVSHFIPSSSYVVVYAFIVSYHDITLYCCRYAFIAVQIS